MGSLNLSYEQRQDRKTAFSWVLTRDISIVPCEGESPKFVEVAGNPLLLIELDEIHQRFCKAWRILADCSDVTVSNEQIKLFVIYSLMLQHDKTRRQRILGVRFEDAFNCPLWPLTLNHSVWRAANRLTLWVDNDVKQTSLAI